MSRTVYYDANGNEIYEDAPTYAQEQLADIERRRTTKDISLDENVDELKKKVLELYDVIDKQNDLIEKYETALRIAGDDIVKTDERCNVCPSIYFCKRKSMTDLACKRTFIADWKEKAGLV